MISPEPSSNTQLVLAASLTAKVRSRWGCGGLITLGIGVLLIKFVSSAIDHLYDIYVRSSARSTMAARILQALGGCLIVLWIVSVVLVYEYYQVWLGLKLFVVSTLVFNVGCTLVGWYEERRQEQSATLTEKISLSDVVSWKKTEREEPPVLWRNDE